jgi:hypothetical protein
VLSKGINIPVLFCLEKAANLPPPRFIPAVSENGIVPS